MAKSVMLLLAAVWLVWPATHLQRSVTAQGLETSDYLLGAGSAATAAEFETFEDALGGSQVWANLGQIYTLMQLLN